MSVSESQNRLCPVCGTLTELPHCPKDGTTTIGTVPFTKHPRSYEAGDIVGERYRITGELGAGGFAAVFAAEHTGTHQAVAIKLLALDPTEDAARVTVRRFCREAQVTSQLSSPHTVRIFDVGQDEGGALYIAMELLRGESLEGLLKRRLRAGDPMTEAEAIDLAVPILESLCEAHAHGLVHRDLKPANIFLSTAHDGSIQVKVLDFGIARTADSSLTLGGSIPGTPPFMSPEQCRGEEVDGRSDLYALAVMLFLCTTAKLPFHHTNVLKLMRMHAFDPPPDPRTMTDCELSEGFASLLLRCLAKQPSLRPLTAAALRDELVAVRDGAWCAGAWDGNTGANETIASVQPVVTDSRREALASGGFSDTQAPEQGHTARPASGGHDLAPAPGVDEALQSAEAAFAAASVAAAAAVSAGPAVGAGPGGVAAPVAPVALARAQAATPAPSAPPRGRLGLTIAVVVLVLVGAGVGVLVASRGNDAASLEADVAARYALKEPDPARRVELARDAVRLAPDNANYRRLLEDSEALLEAARAATAAAPAAAPAATPSAAAPSAAAPAAAAAPIPALAAGNPEPAAPPAPAAALAAPTPAPTSAAPPAATSAPRPAERATALSRPTSSGPAGKPGPGPTKRPNPTSIAPQILDD